MIYAYFTIGEGEKTDKKCVLVLVLMLSSSITSVGTVGHVNCLILGIEAKYQTPYSLPQGWIYVLVETSVFDGIEASLSRYAKDLESVDGFSVGIYTVSTSNRTEIRLFLQQALLEGLVGCLLIGDIPEAYYEWDDPWGGHHKYPTDFYYMDLDGVWSDIDGDGFYDKHSGEASAEIWVGTLQPSLVSGDNIQLLNNYFEKNHLYRTGKLTLPKRALAYLDDGGWDLLAIEEWVYDTIKIAYNETIVERDPEITVASDYRERLVEGYEWIYLMCHGWPGGGHIFMHHGYRDGKLTGLDYQAIDPHTFFYVFCTCEVASGYNNVVSSVVFTDTYGLLSFGSKAGAPYKWGPGTGNWMVTEFYEALSEGKCIGEAYLEDIKFHGYEIPGYEHHWMMAGDPSLHIKGYPLVISIDDLRSKIEELGLEGEIDNPGIVKSLIAKFNVAQKLVDKGKIDEARSILEEDFIPQVQNLLGIHITPEAAEILIESAEYIISHL